MVRCCSATRAAMEISCRQTELNKWYLFSASIRTECHVDECVRVTHRHHAKLLHTTGRRGEEQSWNLPIPVGISAISTNSGNDADNMDTDNMVSRFLYNIAEPNRMVRFVEATDLLKVASEEEVQQLLPLLLMIMRVQSVREAFGALFLGTFAPSVAVS